MVRYRTTGTRLWYLIVIAPVAHAIIAVLVLIQEGLPLKHTPGFLFYGNLVAIFASAYAANVLKQEQAYEAALDLYGGGAVVSTFPPHLLR